jgi:adenosylhomocysteine nucleosidase
MSRVGIIAALPGELKPLVQGWKPLPLPGARKGQAVWASRVDDVECVAVCAGIGSEAAAYACGISAQGGALDAIVSVGWAGALSCGIHPGNAYAVNQVIDARTGEYFPTNFPLPEGSGVPLRLVTTDHIVQYAEKRQLAGLHQAVMVDMEGATVARFALSQNIAFYCLKAISDEIADILPDFGRYTGSDGHLRVAPLLGHVAVRPKYWPAMLRIGQNAKSGARAVAGALRPLIGDA